MSINSLTFNNSFDNRKVLFPCYNDAKTDTSSIFGKKDLTELNSNSGLSIEKPENENPTVVAHRGYTEDAPENTLSAYIAAAKAGYETVECDVAWTKDSVPVLLHDDTINRTARKKNGLPMFFKKECSDLKYKDLLKYDFGIYKGKEHKGTNIPTFSEFTDCCSKNNLKPYIELKETKDFNKEKAQKLVDSVKKAGLEGKVTWISFNADYLKIMKELMPDSRLGFVVKEKPSDKTLEQLNSLKTDSNEVFLDIKSTKIDKNSSKMIKNSGFDFEAWTVNTTKEFEKMNEYDCSGITTDKLFKSDIEKYLN